MAYGVTFFYNGSKRVVDFSACSAFYLLLGQSDDFQVPYMLDQKLVVRFLVTDSISCYRSIISFGVSFDSWYDCSDLPFH